LIAGVLKGYSPAKEFALSLQDTESKYKDFMKRVSDEPSIAKDYVKRLALAKEFESRAGYPQSEARLRKLIAESAVPVGVRDDAYVELAMTQMLQKKFDDARKTIAKFQTVQTKGDAYERSRLLTGDIYLQSGNAAGALAEYRAFRTKFPNSQYNRNLDMMIVQLERQLGAPRR
jgi:predicted negative regulator of RcsB-dependent stress response